MSRELILGIGIVILFLAMAVNYAAAKDYKNAAATLLLAGVNGVLFT